LRGPRNAGHLFRRTRGQRSRAWKERVRLIRRGGHKADNFSCVRLKGYGRNRARVVLQGDRKIEFKQEIRGKRRNKTVLARWPGLGNSHDAIV